MKASSSMQEAQSEKQRGALWAIAVIGKKLERHYLIPE